MQPWVSFQASSMKELGLKPLAHEPALHVDQGGDHGVDPPLGDGHFQFIECQLASHHDRYSISGE